MLTTHPALLKLSLDGTGLLNWPERPLHVILATTGSVASIKAPLIVRELLRVSENDWPPQADVNTKPVWKDLCASSSHQEFFAFLQPCLTERIGRCQNMARRRWVECKFLLILMSAADMRQNWSKVSDPILHIEVRFDVQTFCYLLLLHAAPKMGWHHPGSTVFGKHASKDSWGHLR